MEEATAAEGGADKSMASEAKTEGQSGSLMEENKARESPEDEANGQVIRANSPVEYYVNYVEQERPMDRWVKEKMVCINDELVDDLLEDFK